MKRKLAIICIICFICSVIFVDGAGYTGMDVKAENNAKLSDELPYIVKDGWENINGSAISDNKVTTISSGWTSFYNSLKLEAEESFEFSANIKADVSADTMYTIWFGLASTEFNNAFSLRVQNNTSTGNFQTAIYGKDNKRIVGWPDFPAGTNKNDFVIKLRVDGKKASVYVNGKIIFDKVDLSGKGYEGGMLGVQVRKTAATFENIAYRTSNDHTPIDEKPFPFAINEGWENVSGATIDKNTIITGNSGWSSFYNTVKLGNDENFEFSTNIKASVSADTMYTIWFGLASTEFNNAFSLRVQNNTSTGNFQTAIYGKDNKRIVGWPDFPAGTNKDDFVIKLRVDGKKASVYVNGKIIFDKVDLSDKGYEGGMVGVQVRKTAATFENIVYRSSVSHAETITEMPVVILPYTPQQKWVDIQNTLISGNKAETLIDDGYSYFYNPTKLSTDEIFSIKASVEIKPNETPMLSLLIGGSDTSFKDCITVRFQNNEDKSKLIVAVYGGDNKKIAGWSEISGEDKNKFDFEFLMYNQSIYLEINDKLIFDGADISDKNYSGGYIGFSVRNTLINFNNLEYKTENEYSINRDYPAAVNQQSNILTTGFKATDNGFTSKNSDTSDAVGFKIPVDNNYVLDMDVSELRGSKMFSLLFGLQSSYNVNSDGYSVRFQFGEKAGYGNSAVYEDKNSANKRLIRWVCWPETLSRDSFHLKVIVKGDSVIVYADDYMILNGIFEGDKSGYLGLSTYKSGINVQNVTVATYDDIKLTADESYSVYDEYKQWNIIGDAFEVIRNNNLYSKNISGPSRVITTKKIYGNFMFETDVNLIFGETGSYTVSIGTKEKDKIDGGYSMRVQLDNKTHKPIVSIYNNETNKRISTKWESFPEGSNIENFKLSVKVWNNVIVALVDDVIVGTTPLLEDLGEGYLTIEARQSAKLDNIRISKSNDSVIPAAGDTSFNKIPLCIAAFCFSSAIIMIILFGKRKYRRECDAVK